MRNRLLVVMLLMSTCLSQETTVVPTLRTTARLVQIDVVASNKNGIPARDLQKSDFTILEDGIPQEIRIFDAHQALKGREVIAAKPEKLESSSSQANAFTNQPGPNTTSSWTILLFDLLNTPATDQQQARKQLSKLLESLPAGEPVALFTLTSRLTMVQSFTTQPASLLGAVQRLAITPSPLLTTESQRQQSIGDISFVAVATTPGVNASGSGNNQSSGGSVKDASKWLSGYREMEGMRTQARVILTLDALSGIARAISGYSGRKNLVWLSGGFPVSLGPNQTSADPWRHEKNYRSALDEASTLLANSRVAVYPVDIRGLQGRGVDLSVNTSASQVYVMSPTGDLKNTPSVDAASNLNVEQTFTSFNERDTMVDLADRTGGRAFVGTNDYSGAVARAIDDGSTYYTIAYTPRKRDIAGFHQVEVRSNTADVKLSYRRGYYSTPQPAANKEVGIAALRGALQPGMPPSTSVWFTVKAHPPTSDRRTVLLDYSIHPSNVSFTAKADGSKRVVVDCVVLAFDSEGKEAAHASDTLDGTIPSSAYESIMRQGLPASQELELPTGSYHLRIGVMDRESQQFGTLEISLQIP